MYRWSNVSVYTCGREQQSLILYFQLLSVRHGMHSHYRDSSRDVDDVTKIRSNNDNDNYESDHRRRRRPLRSIRTLDVMRHDYDYPRAHAWATEPWRPTHRPTVLHERTTARWSVVVSCVLHCYKMCPKFSGNLPVNPVTRATTNFRGTGKSGLVGYH